MKKFKLYDTWISIIMIAVFTIVSVIRMDGTFIAGYFTIGAWQVISMLVHYFNKWFTESPGPRRLYHRFMLILVVAAVIGICIPIIGYFILMVLLFAAPVLAIVYTCICHNEVYVKMQRPLALLK